jgi:peptide/nickel transport system substrate-binding protein
VATLAVVLAACGGGDADTGDASADADQATGDAADAAQEDAAGDEATDDAPPAEETGGDVLVFGTTDRPSTIDPADVYEKFASDLLFNTTNRLVEFDPETDEIGPGVAESWEVSDDGRTYTFTLRDGVVFQDGSEMTSEDVAWSLNRTLNINHPDGASFLLAGIETIDTPDPQTVVVTIAEADSTFLARLNYTVATVLPSDSDVYAAPEERLEAAGDDDAAGEALLDEAESFITREQVVGTGPYELTDYQPGVSMTLERFADYWGEAPAIDTIRIQFFESTTQMRNALAAGEIDMAMNDLDPTETASLEEEEGIEVLSEPGGRTSYIVFDVTQEPFTDPAVRRTMAALIDRERIVEEAFQGQAQPLFSMLPESYGASRDYMSDLEPELEGVEDPIEFELWYPADRYTNQAQVAEVITRSLNESGLFNVTTNTAEWATEYSTHLTDGAYGAFLLGWYPDYVDPHSFIEPFYHSQRGLFGYYANDAMDTLIDEAQEVEQGSAERDEIYDEIQQLAAEDMPFIPLYSEGQEAYFDERVQGVEDTLGPAQQTWFYVLSLQE